MEDAISGLPYSCWLLWGSSSPCRKISYATFSYTPPIRQYFSYTFLSIFPWCCPARSHHTGFTWLSTRGERARRIQNCCNPDALSLFFWLFPTTTHPLQWSSVGMGRRLPCARSTSIELPTIISLMASIGGT